MSDHTRAQRAGALLMRLFCAGVLTHLVASFWWPWNGCGPPEPMPESAAAFPGWAAILQPANLPDVYLLYQHQQLSRSVKTILCFVLASVIHVIGSAFGFYDRLSMIAVSTAVIAFAPPSCASCPAAAAAAAAAAARPEPSLFSSFLAGKEGRPPAPPEMSDVLTSAESLALVVLMHTTTTLIALSLERTGRLAFLRDHPSLGKPVGGAPAPVAAAPFPNPTSCGDSPLTVSESSDSSSCASEHTCSQASTAAGPAAAPAPWGSPLAAARESEAEERAAARRAEAEAKAAAKIEKEKEKEQRRAAKRAQGGDGERRHPSRPAGLSLGGDAIKPRTNPIFQSKLAVDQRIGEPRSAISRGDKYAAGAWGECKDVEVERRVAAEAFRAQLSLHAGLLAIFLLEWGKSFLLGQVLPFTTMPDLNESARGTYWGHLLPASLSAASGRAWTNSVTVAGLIAGRVFVHSWRDHQHAQRAARDAFLLVVLVNLACNGWAYSVHASEGEARVDGGEATAWMYYTFVSGVFLSSMLVATVITSWRGRAALLGVNLASSALIFGRYAKGESPFEQVIILCVALASGTSVAHFVVRSHRAQALAAFSRDDWFAQLMIRHEQLEQRSQLWDASQEERSLLERVFDPETLSDKLLRARVDIADLHVAEKLGQGSFGAVFAATWRDRPVAAKKLHRNKMSAADLLGVKRSAELQLSLPAHANLIGLIGVAWSIDSASVILVQDLALGSTLGAALKGSSLKWASQKLPIAAGLASGLAFLHGQLPNAVIHRDLKPDNVLLDPALGSCKIGDFGLSREVAVDVTMTQEVGTPLFSAPELIGSMMVALPAGRQPYDESVDLFSLGAVLACMQHNSQIPYESDELAKHGNAVSDITSGALRPSAPAGALFRPLIDACCQHVPGRRHTAAQALLALEDPALAAAAAREDSWVPGMPR